MLRQPITSAVSASVAFDAAGCQAYLGALDGILTAYHIRIGLTVRSPQLYRRVPEARIFVHVLGARERQALHDMASQLQGNFSGF